MSPKPNRATAGAERDYSQTLFLPQTDFPLRAGLPAREPLLLQRWSELKLYERLRAQAQGRTRFVLHDGPPYANGNIHIGHALNKILKDLVARSQGCGVRLPHEARDDDGVAVCRDGPHAALSSFPASRKVLMTLNR